MKTSIIQDFAKLVYPNF